MRGSSTSWRWGEDTYVCFTGRQLIDLQCCVCYQGVTHTWALKASSSQMQLLVCLSPASQQLGTATSGPKWRPRKKGATSHNGKAIITCNAADVEESFQ